MVGCFLLKYLVCGFLCAFDDSLVWKKSENLILPMSEAEIFENSVLKQLSAPFLEIVTYTSV